MKLIQVTKGAATSIWIWKFLLTYPYVDALNISFYPDYENSAWSVQVKLWKRRK